MAFKETGLAWRALEVWTLGRSSRQKHIRTIQRCNTFLLTIILFLLKFVIRHLRYLQYRRPFKDLSKYLPIDGNVPWSD